MRPEKSKEQVLKERAEDLHALFNYFAVTRVLHCPAYQPIPGIFSWDYFQSARRFYKDWKAKKIRKTIENRKLYGKILKAWNETLGIPTGLIADVIGVYKHVRIPFDEVISKVNGYIHLRGGKRVYKGVVKSSFCGMYIPACGVDWKKLLEDERYLDVDTIPNASDRIKKIIHKWEDKNETTDARRAGEKD